MAIGTVLWFTKFKGYGFIRPDGGGPDMFVHMSAVERAGLEDLAPGQRVSYDVGSAADRPTAEQLQLLRTDHAPSSRQTNLQDL